MRNAVPIIGSNSFLANSSMSVLNSGNSQRVSSQLYSDQDTQKDEEEMNSPQIVGSQEYANTLNSSMMNSTMNFQQSTSTESEDSSIDSVQSGNLQPGYYPDKGIVTPMSKKPQYAFGADEKNRLKKFQDTGAGVYTAESQVERAIEDEETAAGIKADLVGYDATAELAAHNSSIIGTP